MAGISPEQGPPLGVPFSFYFTAPLALVAAGVLLAWNGGDPSQQAALVHLGTVGFLLFVMCGSLYQVLPVVAGAVVPWPRAAHLVHAVLVGGAVSLVSGFVTANPSFFTAAIALLGAGLVGFLVPTLWAIARSSMTTPTAWGLRLALVALAAVAWAGLLLAWIRAGHVFTGDWLARRTAHVHLGLLAWVGGLVSAVSWQVLPMFFLVKPPSPGLARGVLGAVAFTLVALMVAVLGFAPHQLVPWLALPGAVAVWLVQPAWALEALATRKRKRKDATLWLWWVALGLAPVCALLGALAGFTIADWAPRLYGFVALWGWAGALVHAMLTRIVPFLVWLHWCAPRVGQPGVPSARELLPDKWVTLGAELHVVTLVLGVGAVISGHALAWRALGVGLAATGAWLVVLLGVALRRGRP